MSYKNMQTSTNSVMTKSQAIQLPVFAHCNFCSLFFLQQYECTSRLLFQYFTHPSAIVQFEWFRFFTLLKRYKKRNIAVAGVCYWLRGGGRGERLQWGFGVDGGAARHYLCETEKQYKLIILQCISIIVTRDRKPHVKSMPGLARLVLSFMHFLQRMTFSENPTHIVISLRTQTWEGQEDYVLILEPMKILRDSAIAVIIKG